MWTWTPSSPLSRSGTGQRYTTFPCSSEAATAAPACRGQTPHRAPRRAAVASRDRPEVHNLPVIIGGGNRGVVLSATYAARVFGVRSAMSMTRARRLCPQAAVIAPDYDQISERG